MSDPVVLSASSVTTYLRCGQQWYFAYVAAIKSPPSLKQARGTAVHKAVEVNMIQKVTTRIDLPVADVVDAYSTSWDAQAPEIEATAKELGKIKDEGVALTKLHRLEVSPIIQPAWVEQKVQFDINGVPYSGQIDLVDEMHRIRDTKTTGRRPTGESYLLNMTGYAIAYRHHTGEVETETILDYLVSTKRPYYLPIDSNGPQTDAQIQRFANVVEATALGIQAGRFVPNGLVNNACGWCGYRAMCPAYEERQLIDIQLIEP